ncbi:MAG: T9SS type A sorting domain-containing protein [Bacteroidales bacterium]|nr:T9SS type A sorting domain-containing protein [Bacteroidales bacterium]
MMTQIETKNYPLHEAPRSWMAAEQSAALDRQIVDNLMEEGLTAEALELLGLMPALYNLQQEALAEHNRFVSLKNMQANLISSGRNLLELQADEISQLEALTEQSTGRAGKQARNMLAFAAGYTYCDCPTPIDSSLKQTIATAKPSGLEQLLHIEATPNPAKHWVSFTYELPLGINEAVLEVADARGRLLGSEKLSSNKGQSLWDIRGITGGIYYFRLTANGFSKSGKIVIVD